MDDDTVRQDDKECGLTTGEGAGPGETSEDVSPSLLEGITDESMMLILAESISRARPGDISYPKGPENLKDCVSPVPQDSLPQGNSKPQSVLSELSSFTLQKDTLASSCETHVSPGFDMTLVRQNFILAAMTDEKNTKSDDEATGTTGQLPSEVSPSMTRGDTFASSSETHVSPGFDMILERQNLILADEKTTRTDEAAGELRSIHQTSELSHSGSEFEKARQSGEDLARVTPLGNVINETSAPEATAGQEASPSQTNLSARLGACPAPHSTPSTQLPSDSILHAHNPLTLHHSPIHTSNLHITSPSNCVTTLPRNASSPSGISSSSIPHNPSGTHIDSFSATQMSISSPPNQNMSSSIPSGFSSHHQCSSRLCISPSLPEHPCDPVSPHPLSPSVIDVPGNSSQQALDIPILNSQKTTPHPKLGSSVSPISSTTGSVLHHSSVCTVTLDSSMEVVEVEMDEEVGEGVGPGRERDLLSTSAVLENVSPSVSLVDLSSPGSNVYLNFDEECDVNGED